MQIGVDIGGTFTDVVCRDPRGGLRFVKVPSTRGDPGQAVLNSIAHMSKHWQVSPDAIARFAHGTTVATNAVLERKGARIGLITTAGFKDVLEVGRQMRHQMYNVILDPETPSFLAPGARRKEVAERVAADGSVLIPLDAAAVARVAGELAADGVEAIAICFLFSFVNPDHERRARDIVRQAHPQIVVTTSHEVDPAFREYERTVVTAFDAYVKPVIDRYLGGLESGLGKAGVPAPLQVMQSRGGLMVSQIARQRPVRLFLSGPAAGVIGARIVGRSSGIDDLITVDIGGTSCDIALIAKGKALIRSEGVIDGFPVRVAMVDVNSIGAGGGSIAWLDRAGGLRVGPHSAGSEPGPACYGRGGNEPTVTDASIVLGYVNPNYFAGGSLKLDPERARAVIAKLAQPLGLTVEQAALGIHRVLNAQMAEGIRLVSIRQGLDPRQYALLPLGGGGPVHATALARELSIGRIVVPRYPGVLSAAGLLAAPVEHEVSAAFARPLQAPSAPELRVELAKLDRQCDALMAAETIERSTVTIHYFADVCYIGQAYSLEIPLHLDGAEPLARLYDDFLKVHDRVYGHATPSPARIVNIRTIHRAGGMEVLDDAEAGRGGAQPQKGTRRILVAGQRDFIDAAVYDREATAPGYAFRGPAIVEQQDTTTLVEPGWLGIIDRVGNLILTQ
ncbi:MAG: hydantoinase/oxoprolinase family protein [Alphaproteobacteria bacterium]|nr:hydantoinase/oxoprolinase family protein [Alphaproteobacteria bacterium]